MSSKSKSRVSACLPILNLGSSPDAIAKKLKKLGIKGEKGDASSCALAAYVRQEHEEFERIEVCNTVDFELGGISFEVPLPRAYRDFVTRFDAGKYPDLVE